MDAAIVARIDARLDEICREHDVRIPLAIESGSRAWGFPSPDSDYDCRFIYVRPARHYLSLWPQRDVIETPLDDVLDVNGWDLAKALRLLLKGNAVVIEWLTSPISYASDPQFRDDFLALSHSVADRLLIGRHYLRLGERQRQTYFREGRPVARKKIFYALRPAAALRWLRHHPGNAVAPMHFPTLLSECDPPDTVSAIVAELTARKSVTRELGAEPLPEAIRRFVDDELERAREIFETQPHHASADAQKMCDAFSMSSLRRFEGAL